jgi:glucose-6-phosphate 1-epimerase
MDIDRLNAEHGIESQLRFTPGKGGFNWIEIDNGLAKAIISPYAGQVLSYRPATAAEDLLFLSDKAYFRNGKAIKGGIPLCWPWFGPDPESRGRPAHGFARTWQWTVLDTKTLEDGATRVTLGIADDRDTRAIWPYYFNLVLEVTVGSTLRLDLTTRNAGDVPLRITQALHTYFKVGDVTKTGVTGLEGCRYIDKLADAALRTQEGPVTIAGETDRIYESVPGELALEDESLDRRIRIRNENSTTCVVWNPWVETAQAMADLGDGDYRGMLCVETANAASEVIEIPAQGDYRLTTEYAVERL